MNQKIHQNNWISKFWSSIFFMNLFIAKYIEYVQEYKNRLSNIFSNYIQYLGVLGMIGMPGEKGMVIIALKYEKK